MGFIYALSIIRMTAWQLPVRCDLLILISVLSQVYRYLLRGQIKNFRCIRCTSKFISYILIYRFLDS